jgi:hypothetical protein
MRKAFFVSALLLLTACGLAWSASAAAADLTPADPGLDLGSLGIPQPTFMASCTVYCNPDPYNPSATPISCSSSSGNCYHSAPKGVEMLFCDGVVYVCPMYF